MVWQGEDGRALARIDSDFYVEVRADRTAVDWPETLGWVALYREHGPGDRMPEGYGREMEARWQRDAAERARAPPRVAVRSPRHKQRERS